MSKLFSLMLLASLLGIVSAGFTVTFVGTCTQNVTAQKMVFFNLSNIGNDSAFNLQISPFITGAPGLPASSVKSLGPGDHATLNISLTNLTAVGSYVDYFAVSYQQGSTTFTALFPCLFEFGPIARANVVASYSTSYKNGQYDINASVYNEGNYTVDTTVSLLMPEGFNYITPRSVLRTIAPFETNYTLFVVQAQQPGGPASGVIAVNYTKSGVNYASMTPLGLANPVAAPASNTASLPQWLLFVMVAAVIILIFGALIFRAHLRRKRSQQVTESS